MQYIRQFLLTLSFAALERPLSDDIYFKRGFYRKRGRLLGLNSRVLPHPDKEGVTSTQDHLNRRNQIPKDEAHFTKSRVPNCQSALLWDSAAPPTAGGWLCRRAPSRVAVSSQVVLACSAVTAVPNIPYICMCLHPPTAIADRNRGPGIGWCGASRQIRQPSAGKTWEWLTPHMKPGHLRVGAHTVQHARKPAALGFKPALRTLTWM
ncbi:hypothetical protein EJ06DRAFT_360978 [Trichodelitschia bisporula]|uniref:Uncharacterized protein n=1 Tax=Trichodelitschia bisporula TaxID=703511 RepID=A0A6G1I0I9_9PEZI|nr:hypothetical protein EJ06DRAFT_360978 [Trichodelitschia bisporula]